MNKEQRDKIASALGIPEDEQSVLDGGNRHQYTCRCQVCLNWWVLMGPEDPETGEGFGPFTKEQIDAAKFRGNELYDKELK